MDAPDAALRVLPSSCGGARLVRRVLARGACLRGAFTPHCSTQAGVSRGLAVLLSSLALFVGACGDDPLGEPPASRAVGHPAAWEALPYALEVLEVSFGLGAGFGQERMPNVVLGPPVPGGEQQGSVDVLSLGVGGELVLGLGGGRWFVDGPGVDLVVFENAFRYGPGGSKVFGEPAEVSLSEDGETWRSFGCEPTEPAPPWEHCAGQAPVRAFDASSPELLHEDSGGDGFDLGVLGLERARYVRLRDRSAGEALAPTAGFDLDAVGAVHWDEGP